MTGQTQHISVCICTYKRQRFLKRLLEELGRQEIQNEFTYSIVVADNDCTESAKPVVLEFSRSSSVPVEYCVEPEQNIALVRNRALKNANGDFVAFIDDDEFPISDWLLKLLRACKQSGADGVLGPVKPFFEQQPPNWLVKGRFCERPEHKTGLVLDWQQTRTGNVLFKRNILEGMEEPFRRIFGSGAEDRDFFKRMIEAGRIFTWCNEAIVFEVVPPERWKRRYFLKRALLQGQNQKHLTNFRSIAKSIIAIPLYTILLPFLLLVGHRMFMKYLLKLADHIGKLVAIIGFKPLGDKYLTV